jgi:glycerol transport system ATP-binding protein
VVVMTRGRAVQMGSAAELFERPSHTFVGHFIGSPGMNFITAQVLQGKVHASGKVLDIPQGIKIPDGDIKLGIRPEYLTLTVANAPGALPMSVTQIQDVGTHIILSASSAGQSIKARMPVELATYTKGDTVWLQVLGEHTCIYKDEEIVA